MGQVPPKYFLPSAPYGASEAVNALSPVQPAATNPQQPLLPPNFGQQPMAPNQQNPFNPFLPGT